MKNLSLFILLTFLSSCSLIKENQTSIIRIKGSDTMLLLNHKLAEEFMKSNEGISVYVDGGGTKTGVRALLDNTIDICAASRPLEADEIRSFGEEFNSVGMSYLIARDALSIYVNRNNKIKTLTKEQVAKIFKCEITNWNELGGDNAQIRPITRSSASGTYLYFRKHVLQGESICENIPFANTTREISHFVQKNKYSIGYGGIGYADTSMQSKIDGIMPTRENVLNNSYPISRYLRYYTKRKPKGNVKLFIDWVTSKNGQNIVETVGYIPLWDQ
jgi:phosphate transport system substrate-binding protein